MTTTSRTLVRIGSLPRGSLFWDERNDCVAEVVSEFPFPWRRQNPDRLAVLLTHGTGYEMLAEADELVEPIAKQEDES